MSKRTVVIGASMLGAALLLSGCSSKVSETGSEGSALGGEGISPAGIAVSGGAVYFTDDGAASKSRGVNKAQVGGSSSTLLAPARFEPGLIVADDNFVWWVEQSGTTASTLRRVPTSGGPPEVIDDSRPEIGALAMDQRNVYYSDKSTGALYKVPLAGGSPVLLYAANNAVLRALASDGQFLYFALAYDAPGGQILRVPIDGGAGPSSVVDGLGAPFALAIDATQVCWREMQRGNVGCALLAGGGGTVAGPATILATQQSFLPMHGTLLAMDQTSLFYPSGKEIRRLARAPGGSPQVVAVGGEFVSAIGALAIDGPNVYWAESDSLRQIDKAHLSTRTAGGGSDTPSCSSDYNGSYFGRFLYEYDTGDPNHPPLVKVAGSVSVTLTFKCLATALGTTALTVTHAVVDDPYFGCQLAGCTPLFGSAAALPSAPPTTPSYMAQAGQGVVVLFPNGATLGTTNLAGALNVTGGGRILSNSLSPAFLNNTWSAVSTPSTIPFPPQLQADLPVVRWTSWDLAHSAL